MFWIRTLAVALIATVAVSAEDKKPAEFDAKALVGSWSFTGGTRAGEKIDADKLKDVAEYTADKITMKAADATFVFKYSVGAKAKPVFVELEILEPEGFKGAKAKGIVEIDGETMKLAYNPTPDGARPVDYTSTKDNGHHVYVMKKAKKVEKKDDK